MTIDQSQLAAAFEQAKTEILTDIDEGTVPPEVRTFGELHVFIDANTYGGLTDENYQADIHKTIEFGNELQTRIDGWLRAGRPTTT